MGRIPTGRPKGRPKGTGRLGETVTRLTVRIPDVLYHQVVAFASGRSFHRGDPQLSDCVRDALAHYLACPHKRLTSNSPVPSVPLGEEEPTPLVQHNEQTENSTNLLRPTGKRATRVRLDADDLEDMPLAPDNAHGAHIRQPENGTQVPDGMAVGRPIAEPEDKESVEWRRWAILTQLHAAQEPCKPGDIARKIGYSNGVVRQDLELLRKQGSVDRDEQGGYVYRRPVPTEDAIHEATQAEAAPAVPPAAKRKGGRARR
jgi:DNA-binding transcriptional ArsR family regulator